MQEKTITITIDERGNSTLDLEGFAGKNCEKAFDDFRSGDVMKMERKSPPITPARRSSEKRANTEGGPACCSMR
jgi:hypothetical protein